MDYGQYYDTEENPIVAMMAADDNLQRIINHVKQKLQVRGAPYGKPLEVNLPQATILGRIKAIVRVDMGDSRTVDEDRRVKVERLLGLVAEGILTDTMVYLQNKAVYEDRVKNPVKVQADPYFEPSVRAEKYANYGNH